MSLSNIDLIKVYKEGVTPEIAKLENYLRELDPPKETKKNAYFGRNKETEETLDEFDLEELRAFVK